MGESGCGKSTTGRLVLRLLEKPNGQILYDARDLSRIKRKEMRSMRSRMQIIFQDPYASLDPRKTVFQTLCEPFQIHYPQMSREEMIEKVARLVDCVGCAPEHITRVSSSFRRTETAHRHCQAAALNPDLIVCDEPGIRSGCFNTGTGGSI